MSPAPARPRRLGSAAPARRCTASQCGRVLLEACRTDRCRTIAQTQAGRSEPLSILAVVGLDLRFGDGFGLQGMPTTICRTCGLEEIDDRPGVGGRLHRHVIRLLQLLSGELHESNPLASRTPRARFRCSSSAGNWPSISSRKARSCSGLAEICSRFRASQISIRSGKCLRNSDSRLRHEKNRVAKSNSRPKSEVNPRLRSQGRAEPCR